MVAVDIFVLFLKLIGHVIKYTSRHANVRVSSLKSSVPGSLVVREESSVTVPSSSDVAFPAIGPDCHVNPFSFGGIVSIVLSKN